MMNPFQLSSLFAAGLAFSASLVSQVQLPPAGLNPGEQYRVFFVTEATRDATSTDIGDYDALVASSVAASPLAQLNVTWQCFGSTATVAARDHAMNPFADVPIYRPDGVKVAANRQQFLGTASGFALDAGPSVTENGSTTTASRAWTGTWPNGTANPSALGTAGPNVLSGAPIVTHYGWCFGNFIPRTSLRPLYGISAVLTVPTPPATTQIPLNCNFNGMVHSGEFNSPDNLDSFRSVSDRAIVWDSNLAEHAILRRYNLVATGLIPDIVHLGDRNLVDNGRWAFDASPDGDNLGVQPNWLPNSDQTGQQITTLAEPLPIGNARLSLCYNVSNGGGSFDVTVQLQSGASVVTTVTAPDWFGGDILASENVDMPQVNFPLTYLNVAEATIDLSVHTGDSITAIEFGNRSNVQAGYAIYGARVDEFEVFGTGCGGTPPLTLAPEAPALLGQPLPLHVTEIPTGTLLGLLIYGEIEQSIDLTPIGATNCGLFVNALITFGFPVAGASSQSIVQMPNDPLFVGYDLNFQAAVLTPGINPFGMATSNGVRLTLQ